MKQSHKTLLLWVLLIVMFLAIWQFLTPGERKQPTAFNALVQMVHEGKVESIHIKGTEYTFTYKRDEKATKLQGETTGPVPDTHVYEMLKPVAVAGQPAPVGPEIFYDKEDSNPFWSNTLITLLPMLFIGVLFFLFMRAASGGRRQGDVLRQGQGAHAHRDSQNKVSARDVAGIDEAKDEVEEIIAFLKDPKKFQRLGGQIPKGRAPHRLRREPARPCWRAPRSRARRSVPFFSISGSNFVEMFVGIGASLSATSSSRARSTRRASSSSAGSMPSAGTAAQASAAVTTSASRR